MKVQPYTTNNNFQPVLENLRSFIELSLQKKEAGWSEWISRAHKRIEKKCWEKLGCDEKKCPAYHHDCGRCWLIAGTMCGGSIQGKFALKYSSCTKCEFFKEVVAEDDARELQEHILILIHSLRSKQMELKQALDDVRTLSGLLPICMNCRQIRDDKGYWSNLETYVGQHSEVQFSHALCPGCVKELYPDIYDDVVKRVENRPDK